MKKKSFSLRSQLLGLMSLLVLLQSMALVAALVASNVFFMLDAEAYRLFSSTTSARTQSYDESVGKLIWNMAEGSRDLSAVFQAEAVEAGVDEQALYYQPEGYRKAAIAATETLRSLMRNNQVSGAFFLLEGSDTHREDAAYHGGVYLRNAAMGSTSGQGNYQLEIGPIAVSRELSIPTSIRWELDISIPKEDERGSFYEKPMWAARQAPGVELERYGYWATPSDVLGDGQQVATYTMPILDSRGIPMGVLGVEISLPMFTQHYLPTAELPYESSFYAIARVVGETIDLSWKIPGGPLAQVYLPNGRNLEIVPMAEVENLYLTQVSGLGDMYCAVQPLTMYSRNSPFYEDSWSLIGFVPKEVLHETSYGVRLVLIVSIASTTLLAFVAIFLMTYFTTRRISGLSKYIQGQSPFSNIVFQRTGIREIDDLTTEVEKLNRSVRNASQTTSKILELTLLPIGGFESTQDTGYVVLTEYVYQLLNIPPGTEISKEDWQKIYERLVATPAEDYENTYEYTDDEGKEKWLRIVTANTETGHMGVILDVTKDITENKRLAHELDYDALTHLYSRNAFKREVYRHIQEEPGKLGAMVFVDLDNLKYINDTYGHDMGDRLIIRAGELFRQFQRLGGVVARISGDEFAIYLHGYDTKEEIRNLITRQYGQDDEYALKTPDGQWQKIRFSSGIAYYPDDSDNATDLLKLSDYAMYEAKHNQKGAMFEFNQESYNKNLFLLKNREAINSLLDEQLIRFAFQPIVDLSTGEVFAYELLMRPLLDNFKSPLEILAVAASQSKLGQLERLVMFMAMQTIEEHLSDLGEAKVFLNSIPSQALTDEDSMMLEEKYSHFYGRIVMEITELESNAPELLLQKATYFKSHGMMLALDDYGSGYSNDVRILSITPDIVKVDIDLVSNIDTDRDKQQLIINLLAFCRPKGIRVVAEGVERREELAELVRLGVDYIQGYYTGRPDFQMRQIDDKIKKEILYLQGRGSV